MTTKEKASIHELLSAYRIGPAIDQLRPHLLPSQTELQEKLAKLEGRYEHFRNAAQADYSPTERRAENDALVKSLQLLLSKFEINDQPKTLADIIGRDLDEDFKEREKDPVAASPEHQDEQKGFFGVVDYTGSPSAKEGTLNVAKSYGATFHRCLQALKSLNVNVEKSDRDGGRISGATAGNSHAKFGECVLLWLSPQPRGNTFVTVIVDSNLKTTVFDLGRHQALLDKLSHKIQYG